MQHSTGTFYTRLAFIYPMINMFLRTHRNVLMDEVNRVPEGKLLEIGIGNGAHLPLYKKHHITGIDISEGMLSKAHQYKSNTTQLLHMDGEYLSFPPCHFDYVVISHVLAVTKSTQDLLTQVNNVLKPGGTLFILNHFTPGNWLRYIDLAFHPLASLLRFKSVFYQDNIIGLRRFSLMKEKSLGIGSYFKLLIFRKP